MSHGSFKGKAVSTLTLFSSFSTLICCALPALLVTLGAGSAMAGLVSAFPLLVAVSRHKTAVFIFAGIMLLLSALMQWHNRFAPCPIDPVQARTCLRLRKYSAVVFGISLAAYFTGAFFAFFAAYFVK